MTNSKKTKKKGISPQDGRRWLQELETGRGITSIAADAFSDIRTVKRHIEIAREEGRAALARRDFLLKRLEQHQDDLLAEVVRLQKLIARHAPTRLTPDEPRGEKIFGALKEHFGRLPLKKQLDQWQDIFARYSAFKEGVSSELGDEQSCLVSAIPGEPVSYPWAPTIVEVLESGHSFEELDRTYNREPQADGKYKVSWNARILTRLGVTDEQATRLIEAHKKLVTFAKKYSPEFEEYRQKFQTLYAPLLEELDVFNIKRVVSGRCRYCPV